MGRLDDKVCLITGAARGMGAAEAELFAAEGASVWVTDVADDAGTETAASCGGTYRHLDVRDETAWSGVIDDIIAIHGRIDVLVNNAGIYANGRHYEIDLNEFNQVMDINCVGMFLGMRAVSPHMRQAGSGSIINISSVAGLVGGQGAFAYFTSKWAARGMTKCAAIENSRTGVRVNSIHPGLIETDMLAQLPAMESDRVVKERVPLGRTATATEVANMALFLASDESSYSTGCEFVVDGGMTAI